jgi:endonuclease G
LTVPKLSAAQQTELLDLLLEFPATKTADQREALLFSLPPQITNSLDLSGDRYAAIVKLVESVEYWGQLADGRWVTEVVLRNALRAARNTQFEVRIEAIRQLFDLPAAKVQLNQLPEKIASDVSYLMPVGFLEAGHRASRAVARLSVQQVFDGEPAMRDGHPSLGLGTGWLISPNLLLTNHHVVAARFAGEPPARESDLQQQAARTEAWFDFVAVDRPKVVYQARALEAIDQALDYAVLRLADDATRGGPLLSSWGWLRLAPDGQELTAGRPLNIVQHPSGDVKQIAIRRNDYVGPGQGEEFQYLTDTLPGSSGSPVFNDYWLVVGLHRASQTVPEKVYKGETIKYNNVGVRIHAIVKHLPEALRNEIAAAGR